MKIDQNIVDNFAYLAKVNPKMVIKSDELAVSAENKHCIVYWSWKQTVDGDSRFGIYDMNGLLNVLKLHDIPNTEIIEENNKMKIESSFGINHYALVNEDIDDIFLKPQPKDVFLTDRVKGDPIKLKMGEKFIQLLQKQISVLGSPHVKFVDNKIQILNQHDSSENTYEKELDVSNIETPHFIDAKLFNGMKVSDYEVTIYDNTIIFESYKEITLDDGAVVTESGELCYAFVLLVC